MPTTNYDSISTCAATGQNFAWSLPERDGIVEMPPVRAEDHLGPGSSWEQCRAFDWGMLSVIFERGGDEERAKYCRERVRALKETK